MEFIHYDVADNLSFDFYLSLVGLGVMIYSPSISSIFYSLATGVSDSFFGVASVSNSYGSSGWSSMTSFCSVLYIYDDVSVGLDGFLDLK